MQLTTRTQLTTRLARAFMLAATLAALTLTASTGVGAQTDQDNFNRQIERGTRQCLRDARRDYTRCRRRARNARARARCRAAYRERRSGCSG